MSRSWAKLSGVLSAVLLAAAPAWADVVVLKSGGRISGKVVKDTPQEVVVKTPSGRVVLPRRLVKEVQRESAGETLISLAQERFKAGAIEEARRLYERAAQDPDAQVRARAKAGLASLERRGAKIRRYRKAPRWPFALPAGVTGTPIEGGSLQEQLDRGRRALDDGDGTRALKLLGPLAESNSALPALRYLAGRAHALLGQEAEARKAFQAGVLRRDFAAARPLNWLLELARRRLAGEELGPKSPGWSGSWKRRETERFAFYAQHGMSDALVGQGEALFREVLGALDIRLREASLAGRIQVFVFAEGHELGDARRAGLREGRALAPDGPLWTVAAVAGELRAPLRAAVAHALAESACPGLPEWAGLGVTDLVSPDSERSERLESARLRGARRVSFDELLAGGARAKTPQARSSLAAQAGLILELLTEERGSLRKALHLCAKIAPLGGPEKAFRRFRVDLAKLRAAYENRLGTE